MKFCVILLALALISLHASDSNGGLVLEDTAIGIGPIGKVQYDPKLNAITLDNRNVYFPPVSSRDFAVLCRALAKDDRVGVSLGAAEIVYGAVPKTSDVALVLKLADKFLADIVFAKKDLTAGYRYANGYDPQPENDGADVAAFFRINQIEFGIKKEEIKMTRIGFVDTLVPLVKEKTKDGGNLPDKDAIRAGRKFPQYEANAIHLANEIDYYKNELVIMQAFRYGEVTAFLRALRDGGTNLKELARSVELLAGKNRNFFTDSDHGTVGRPLDLSFGENQKTKKGGHSLEGYWVKYLRDIQARRDYRNWSGRPYDLYRRRHKE